VSITQDIQVGDVLVQHQGQPWVALAQFFTGYPFPHVRLVSDVYKHFVFTVEETPLGVQDTLVGTPSDYVVRRPMCADDIKVRAVEWARTHINEPYDYSRLLQLMLSYRIGNYKQPGMDDNVALDDRKKVCSELVAMAYYRSGYDLVPAVCDRDTLPHELVFSDRLLTVPQPWMEKIKWSS
jgi:uncharacterized protein YycO